MNNCRSISMLVVLSIATSMNASDKTIWGEQIVANSAQSPANKGEGSATPLASRRPANRGLATKKPSRFGRYAARRGETRPVKQVMVKNKKTSKKEKHVNSAAPQDNHTKHTSTHVKKGGVAAETVISTQAQLDALLAQDKPVFVKVSIGGCPPCLAMKPIFAELAADMHDAVAFITIDATKKNFLNVKAYPTFIGYKNGTEQFRLVGESTAHQLRSEISKKLLK